MAKIDLGTLVLGMAIDKTNWSKGITDAIKEGDGFKGKFEGIGSYISGNWKTLMIGGFVAVGAAVGAFVGKAIGQAMEFEDQMAQVSTLLNGTTEEVKARTEELGDSVIDISNNTGKATDDLTNGMYQVISAFGDTEEAIGILEIAAQGAKAGGAETVDAINLLSAVTKGYGDTSVEANQKVSDMAFTVVKLGQTTFPELAGAMGSVVPIAQSLGVSQEELFGVMATFTGVTGNASEVSTQLRGTMQALMAPTDAMAGLISDLGYENGNAMMEALGLQGSIDAITNAATESGEPLQKYIGSIEGQTLALAASGAQSDNLKEKTEAMAQASGASKEAFDRSTDSAKAQYDIMKNKLGNSMTELGRSFLPMVTAGMQLLSPIVDGVTWAINGLADAIGWAIDKAKELWNWVSNSKVGQAVSGFFGGGKSSRSYGVEPEGSYAVGTNYVPYDMVAQIHEGEMIIPADENPNNPTAKRSTNSIVNSGEPFIIKNYTVLDSKVVASSTNRELGKQIDLEGRGLVF